MYLAFYKQLFNQMAVIPFSWQEVKKTSFKLFRENRGESSKHTVKHSVATFHINTIRLEQDRWSDASCPCCVHLHIALPFSIETDDVFWETILRVYATIVAIQQSSPQFDWTQPKRARILQMTIKYFADNGHKDHVIKCTQHIHNTCSGTAELKLIHLQRRAEWSLSNRLIFMSQNCLMENAITHTHTRALEHILRKPKNRIPLTRNGRTMTNVLSACVCLSSLWTGLLVIQWQSKFCGKCFGRPRSWLACTEEDYLIGPGCFRNVREWNGIQS